MPLDYERWKEAQLQPKLVLASAKVGFPLSVMLAGMIWVVIGGVVLMSTVILTLQAGVVESPRRFVFGIGLAFYGFRIASGSTENVVHFGILSMVLGLAWLCVGFYSPQSLEIYPHEWSKHLINLGIGTAISLAGCMAVIGGPGYLKWRKSNPC